MDILLYYIRDNLVGIHYFMYAFVLLFLMFAIIGYLFKQKYAKYEIKLNTSQEVKKEEAKKQGTSSTPTQTSNTLEKKVTLKTNASSNVGNIQVANTSVQSPSPSPLPNPVTKNVATPKPMPNPPTNTVQPTQVNASVVNKNEPIPELK